MTSASRAILLALAAGCSANGASPAVAVAPIAPTPIPTTATQSATPTPAATSTGASGTVSIDVPAPAPVICSPAPIEVTVGQTIAVGCSSANFLGAISASLADATIASVQTTPHQGAISYFFITGLSAGTTTLLLSYPDGGSGTAAIDVTP